MNTKGNTYCAHIAALIALSCCCTSTLKAQPYYYLDYSHDLSMTSSFMSDAGGTFQTDLTGVARQLSTQPESIHYELDMEDFSFISGRGQIRATGMRLINESHFRYATSAPRDEFYHLLDTATTYSDTVNLILEQSSLAFLIEVDSFNSSSLSVSGGSSNPLYDKVYNDPIRSEYCIQRKYTFAFPINLSTDVFELLHQEQLNALLEAVIEVDSEILFPIAIENDIAMTETSNPSQIDHVWIQTFWFSSEAAMNHTLTSLQLSDQNTDSDAHFMSFLNSSGFFSSMGNLTTTETVGSPVEPASFHSIAYSNGQVDLQLNGGANESHLLSWSEDLSTWSGSDINLSVQNGSSHLPIGQTLHVVPAAENTLLSLTFSSAIPPKAFFRLEKSSLLRP